MQTADSSSLLSSDSWTSPQWGPRGGCQLCAALGPTRPRACVARTRRGMATVPSRQAAVPREVALTRSRRRNRSSMRALTGPAPGMGIGARRGTEPNRALTAQGPQSGRRGRMLVRSSRDKLVVTSRGQCDEMLPTCSGLPRPPEARKFHHGRLPL